MNIYKCVCSCCGGEFSITEEEYYNGRDIFCSCFNDITSFYEIEVKVGKDCLIYGNNGKYLILGVDTENYHKTIITQVFLADEHGNQKQIDITDIREVL